MQQGMVGQQQQGMMGNRNVIPNKFNTSHELTDDEAMSNGGSFQGRLPLHSTLLDEIFQGRDKRGVVVGRPLGTGTVTGTRSQCSSPVISSFHHRTGSLSYTDSNNGHAQPRSAPRWDDGGLYFTKRPGETPNVPPSSHPPNHYGSYSPITSNRMPLHLVKPYNNNNMRNRSDTDPFILSQLTSTPVHSQHRAGLHGAAPCSAPTERRVIITNGNHGSLIVPGQPRSNTVQRLFGRQGKPGSGGGVPARNNHNLNQPVQMIDGSTSSGTDTSDTESDTGSSSAYSQPLMYGNPGAVGSVHSNHSNSSPLSRSKFSFGSLQLEEGEDGEGEEGERCYRFNEEDVGGRVFSC